MKILEEFWQGNIEPTEYDATPSKEYKELLQLICRNEEKLQATFTEEQKTCSPDMWIVCESFKLWLIAYCSRAASSWVQECWQKSWNKVLHINLLLV